MSVKFTTASSTKLLVTSGIVNPVPPITIGMWVRPQDVTASRTIWYWGATATDIDEYWRIGHSTTVFTMVAAGGAADDTLVFGGAFTNVWSHIICRYISTTNRRASAIRFATTIPFSTAQDVTAVTNPGGPTPGIALGCRHVPTPDQFFNGDVAEFWMVQGDIADAAVATDRGLHDQIAFQGPLSYPPLAAKLREYWSFDAGPFQLSPSHVAFGLGKHHIWTPSATPPDVGPAPYKPYAQREMQDDRRRRALLGKAIAAGTLFFQTIAGTLSFVGDLSKRTGKALTATLSFTGALSKFTSRALTATLSFIGNLVKQTRRGVAGTLSFIGALVSSRLFSIAFTATLAFVGAVAKRTNKATTGTVSFVGSLAKQTSKAVAGTLNFIGTVNRRTAKALAGTLSFIGAMGKMIPIAFTATLSFTGSLATQFIAGVGGAILRLLAICGVGK